MKGMQRNAHRLLLGYGILVGERSEQVGEIETQRLLRVGERARVVARRVAPVGIAADILNGGIVEATIAFWMIVISSAVMADRSGTLQAMVRPFSSAAGRSAR
jgi:hypothetical protein